MRESRIEKKTIYPFGHVITVVECCGQEEASVGDGVVVRAVLYLPTKDCALVRDIRFGERLLVADEQLKSSWGFIQQELVGASQGEDIDGYRHRAELFRADTWKKAFQDAEMWLRAQTSKIEIAYANRQAALIAADED